jgi:tRNA dimethylallyltransferase
LNIGTGKDLPENSPFIDQTSLFPQKTNECSVGFYVVETIPLWLYDVIPPDKRFSAIQYAQIAREVIKDIWSRGKTAILVGGTGFYIQATIDGFDTEGILPDEKLRRILSTFSVKDLQQKLIDLNIEKWGKMNNSDRQNPPRLIRTIEVSLSKNIKRDKPEPFTKNVQYICRDTSKEELFKRIDARVKKRVEQGIIHEIEEVVKKGYGWDSPGLNTIGYKEWQLYFEGKATKKEAIERWKLNEHAYAKRQETWFKKDKTIQWKSL